MCWRGLPDVPFPAAPARCSAFLRPRLTSALRDLLSAHYRTNAKEEADASIPDPVQLHASNLGQAHQEPFGDHDAYALYEAPDNVSMAATAVAITAGGALSSLQTTVLLTVEDTLAALEKASSIMYRPPGENG